MQFTVKYDVRRDYGGKGLETRREFNRRFSQPEIEPLEIPPVAQYLWDWYWELVSQRHELNPIGYRDIKAWSELMGIQITPFEVKTMVAMDAQCLATHSEEAEYAQKIHDARRAAK